MKNPTADASPPRRAPNLEALALITDPTERAREAVAYAERADTEARAARTIRDHAIREMRDAGTTIPEISKLTGVGVSNVKIIVR